MALVIAAEGSSGGGKTTALNLISETLQIARGFKVGIVETDAISYAPQLKAIAKTFPEGHAARSMLLWVLRIGQHDMIVEMESRVDVVLVDRFWGAPLAMDLYGNGVPRSVLSWVGQFITRMPDVTFFFDIPPEVALARKKSETVADPAFARRVEQGYQELATMLGWIQVDARRSPQEIRDGCLTVILATLRGVKSHPKERD